MKIKSVQFHVHVEIPGLLTSSAVTASKTHSVEFSPELGMIRVTYRPLGGQEPVVCLVPAAHARQILLESEERVEKPGRKVQPPVSDGAYR